MPGKRQARKRQSKFKTEIQQTTVSKLKSRRNVSAVIATAGASAVIAMAQICSRFPSSDLSGISFSIWFFLVGTLFLWRILV